MSESVHIESQMDHSSALSSHPPPFPQQEREPESNDIAIELAWDSAVMKAAMRAASRSKRRYSNASSLSSVTYIDELHQIAFPDGNSRDVVDTTEFLKKLFPIGNNIDGKTAWNNSFSGQQAVDALKVAYTISSTDAVSFGEHLRSSNLLRHVNDEYYPFMEGTGLYRLCCHQHPNVLNSYGRWPSARRCTDPEKLSCSLLDHIHRLEQKLRHRGQINYKYACKTRLFPVFEYAACELQAVDLKTMDNDEKLAFGINIYNVMLRYTWMKEGMEVSSSKRKEQMTRIKFCVGDMLYSLYDWEHGFLRGNRESLEASMPFINLDARANHVVDTPNPRLHFALSRRVSSRSEFIPHLVAENVHSQLELAAERFCSSQENLRIQGNALHLSEIFLAYKSDFDEIHSSHDKSGSNANANTALPRIVRDCLPASCSRREELDDLIKEFGDRITVFPLKYDFNAGLKGSQHTRENSRGNPKSSRTKSLARMA